MLRLDLVSAYHPHQSLVPKYNEQYEVGVKSEWLDNRLNTQFSVFDIRKNNIRYKPNPNEQP
ncbi:hypothetical protein, partial [Acinetobacter oleivorans]|uniref:hypothetical protein n=1 Tax=Acinetobacter oleivorans TaxID=1148157 RepID=UPI00280B2E2C